MHKPRMYADWTAYDNEIIARCDVCLRLVAVNVELGYMQAESSGADAEVELFRQLGKPVFFDGVRLLAWKRNEWGKA
jgi:hypothetical protein